MLALAAPAVLGLLSALLLVAFFYFLRMKFRKQPVSSSFLWESLAQVTEGGARLRYRSILLLVLQLLAVLALVLALADPRWIQQSPARPGVLYLIDGSASMKAKEVGTSKNRFSRALEALRQDLAALPQDAPVSAFLVSDELVAVAGGKVFDPTQRQEFQTGLEALSPGSGGGAEAQAPVLLGLQTWVQTHPGPWTAVLVSDGGLALDPNALSRIFRDGVRALAFALPAPNLGIQDVRLAGSPTETVRASLFNGFPSSQTRSIVLEFEGRRVAQWSATLPPGVSAQTWDLSAPPPTSGGGLWTLSLEANSDSLASDDRFDIAVSPPRPARVLALGPADPFLKAAFAGSDYQTSTSGTLPPGRWDIIVSTGDQLPSGFSGHLITFGALPPQSPVFWGPIVAGRLVTSSTPQPLNRWVPWSEVEASSARSLVVEQGASVLATIDDWPVVVAWQNQGSHSLAIGTDVYHSNLGLTSVLPILLQNFRRTVVPQEFNPLVDNLRVGQTVERAGSEAWHVVSTSVSGGTASLPSQRRGGLWSLKAQEAGTYRWEDQGISGVVAVHQPSGESDTEPRLIPTPATLPTSQQPQGPTTQTTPLAALVVLCFAGIWLAEWRLWNGRLSGRDNPLLFRLRIAAFAAAAMAVVGFTPLLPTNSRSLVLLFDVSASLGPELVSQERSAAELLLRSLHQEDRVSLLSFASTPQVLSGPVSRDQALGLLETLNLGARDTEDAQTSNLQAALIAGSQLLSTQGAPNGSQYLFSDGRTNQGGELDRLTVAARSYPVYTVPLGRELSGVEGRALEVPPSVRPLDEVTVKWTGRTDRNQSVTALIQVDSTVIARLPAKLEVGFNTLEFTINAGKSGVKKVDVELLDAQGLPLPSAQASALLTVEGRRSILLIGGSSSSEALRQALEAQGLPTKRGAPASLSTEASGYASLSCVILDNVPASALNEAQQRQLKTWVSGGGGLLVIGGDRSLGRGEYFTSLLEEMIPVQTDTRQRLQFTRTKILFVIDHSGSMSEDVGRTTKLLAAVQGVEQSLDELNANDEVGILQFDTTASWIIPFTPLSQKKAILDALEGLSQGGGTDVTGALQEVVAAFGRPGPVRRHAILMTDGQTGGEAAFFDDFATKMKASQVSLTVVGIGTDVNDRLLGKLATDSEGQYYRVEGDQVPAVLQKETVRVTRNLIQEGFFVPKAVGQSPIQDLGLPAPEIGGYLATKAKALARVLWEIPRSDGSRDPLWADWRYGAGRVAVVTADSGARWLASWSGRPQYNRFWGQTVRSLEAGAADQGLRIEVSTSASMARLVVEALDADGRLRTGALLTADENGKTVDLQETAPGRYEADVPLPGPGLSLIRVSDRLGGGSRPAWTWTAPGAELVRGGTDWEGLGGLSAATGGRMEPLALPSAPPEQWSWAATDLRAWWLAADLLLALFELGWRSTRLGQLEQAAKVFLAWWADQARPWTKPIVSTAPRTAVEDERRTREAYRALATRRKPETKVSSN